LRSERVALALLAVLVLLPARRANAQTTPAHGQAPAPAARLELDASPACSTRDELVARVAARSTRIRFVTDGAGVPALAARIEPAARGGVIAGLTVVEPDGRKFTRRIEAPSCAAATDALALVVAITLDPAVVMDASPRSAPASPPAPPPGTPAAATPAATASAKSPPPAPPQAEVARVAAPAEGAAPAAPTAPATPYLGAAVSGELIAGPAPTLMPGAALELEAGLERASIWSPAMMLTLAHTWSGDVVEPLGTAAFTLDLVSLDACPLRLVLLRVEARACAAGSLGRLAAQGSRTFDPGSVARAFATAGGAARLAVPSGSRVQVRIRFGAGATLWRDAFQFDRDVFHRVASVTLVGDVGVGVRFP
jgi:hypothetical protein